MVQFANVIVYSYQYLLDPKVAGIISKELQKESVVVFDEAHNIDNVCIEALSVSVRRVTLEGANRNLNKIRQEIDRYANFFLHSRYSLSSLERATLNTTINIVIGSFLFQLNFLIVLECHLGACSLQLLIVGFLMEV